MRRPPCAIHARPPRANLFAASPIPAARPARSSVVASSRSDASQLAASRSAVNPLLVVQPPLHAASLRAASLIPAARLARSIVVGSAASLLAARPHAAQPPLPAVRRPPRLPRLPPPVEPLCPRHSRLQPRLPSPPPPRLNRLPKSPLRKLPTPKVFVGRRFQPHGSSLRKPSRVDARLGQTVVIGSKLNCLEWARDTSFRPRSHCWNRTSPKHFSFSAIVMIASELPTDRDNSLTFYSGSVISFAFSHASPSCRDLPAPSRTK